MADTSEAKNISAERQRGPLYWFFYNLRKRTLSALKNLFQKRPILGIFLSLLLIHGIISGRAFYQPVFLFARKYFVVAILIIIALYLLYRIYHKAKLWGRIGSIVGAAAIAVIMWFYGAPMVNYLALYYHFNSIEKVELAELPVTGFERIQPWNSVKTLIDQEALNETQSATDPHFIRRTDGRFDFTSAIGPSPRYPFQRLTYNMTEILSVSATKSLDFSRDNRHDVNFDVGESLLFSKKVESAAVKKFSPWKFLSYSPDEVRFLEDADGNWVQVVSLIKWKGFLFPRPVFGGVMVIPQRKPGFGEVVKRVYLGKGEYIAPEEIPEYPWLEGQNLVPDRVTRFTAESFRFDEGFLAPFPGLHEGDIRIPDLPDDRNPMPFYAWFNFDGVSRRADNQLYAYFGLEPYSKKQGLNMSLFIPGDGDDRVFYYDHAEKGSGLSGSSAVPAKIKESRKNYDWAVNVPVESRPFIRDIGGERRFFWLTTVVTKVTEGEDGFIGGSNPEVTLTDAVRSKVVWLDDISAEDSGEWETYLLEQLHREWDLPKPVKEEDKPVEIPPVDEAQQGTDSAVQATPVDTLNQL
jgi:hypothetical protein